MRRVLILAVLVVAVAACTPKQQPGTAGAGGSTSPSPSPSVLVSISDNKALLQPQGADFCHVGGQVFFQWTVVGAKQGDDIVVNFSGFANQNNDNVSLPLDVALTASKTFSFVGPGVWKSHVVSVDRGGRRIGTHDNMAAVRCN